MTILANIPIMTALTAAVTPAIQVSPWPPSSMAVQVVFTYGSGGTTADVWVQTSQDAGTTWMDIANVHATTASVSAIYNLSARTSVTSAATPTDGSLAANTSVDGLLGTLYRAKITTTGTYAGSTTLRVDLTPTAAHLTGA
jgi:hypothetical protein